MSRRIAFCFVALVLIGSPGRAQLPIGRDALPTRTALARLGLEKQWSTVVPMGGQNEQLARVNVDGGQLFAQTNQGQLHSYDAETGRYQWGTRLEEVGTEPLPVAVNSAHAFVTNMKTLYCLDRATGALVWKKELEDLPSTGMVADDDLAVVGLRSGKFVAYTVRDRTKEVPPGRSAGTRVWAWQSGARLDATPVLTSKVVAFGSEDSKVYVAIKGWTFAESKLLFRFLTGGPIKARLATFGNRTLIIPSDDFNVYAIDLFSGANRWTVATGAAVEQEPLVAGDDVLVLNVRGRVMSIDGLTGSVKWDRQTNATRMVAASPGRIYLTTLEHRLVILDRQTGQVLADARDTTERAGFDNRSLSLVFSNQVNDRLYFASPSGVIVCLREIGRLQPTPLRDPALPPFGTIPPDGFTSDAEQPVGTLSSNAAAAEEVPEPATEPGTDAPN